MHTLSASSIVSEIAGRPALLVLGIDLGGLSGLVLIATAAVLVVVAITARRGRASDANSIRVAAAQLSGAARRAEPLLLGSTALLLLIVANRSLNDRVWTLATAVVLVAGLGLWLLAARDDRNPLLPWRGTLVPQPTIGGPRLHLLAVCAVASAAAYAWASANTFRPFGVLTWLLAIVAWLAAWWPRDLVSARVRAGVPSFALTSRQVLIVCGVVAAVIVGAFFRIYHIAGTPLDPTSDHAEKLLDVTDVLNGKRPIFFERNTGREPMQFYLTAGLFKTFDLPVTFTSLKLGTGIMGTLAIPFIYLLAAELAGATTGLLAAALYAFAVWPVEIARAGLRFPYAPIAAAATLWFLLRWMRTRDRRDALLCGLAIGLGLYGYTPFRVVVPAVVLGLAVAFIDTPGRAERWRVIGHGALLSVTAAVIFVPLGRYALEKPEMFWYRSAGRLTGDQGGSAFTAFIDNLSIFLRNNLNAALGFNWRGDSTFVNAVTDSPMMDVITGALLLAGMATMLMHVARQRDQRVIFLLLALPVLLLSSTLAIAFPNENPSVNRSGPALPIIFFITALPLAILVRRLRDQLGPIRGALLAVPLLAILLGVAATLNFDRYFHEFDRQTRAGVANTTEIAGVIQGARSVGVALDDAYVIDFPYWLDIRNIGIAMHHIEWGPEHNVRLDDPLPAQQPEHPLFFVLNEQDAVRLAEVQRAYPNAYVTRYASAAPNRSFVTVFVPVAPRPLDRR